MSGLFQNSILRKYLKGTDDKIAEAYRKYAAYFHNPEIRENIRNCREEEFQEGFLRALFVKVLGYTLKPEPRYNLVLERKNVADQRKADGAILVNNDVTGVIELKDGKTTDLKSVETQAFGYKNNNRNASYVVISNFEKLRFYIDNAIDFIEFNLFSLSLEEFAVLWLCLDYGNIAANLPKQIKNESTQSEDQITKQLYKEYAAFKRALFADLTKRNPQYDQLTLFKKSQKLLDRILFILFAEDCGLLPPNSIAEIIKQWEALRDLDEYKPLYGRFKKYFGYMNTGFKGKTHEVFAYNGGLFVPDEVLDKVEISDEALLPHLLTISRYDFSSDVDVNILGHIFENSLNEIEEVTNALSSAGSPPVSRRKKDGVFYTPRYITAYIVNNTLGKLCADKKAELEIDEAEYSPDKKHTQADKRRLEQKLIEYRDWLLSLTICDPACGSGAFLNAALDFLITEHRLIDEMRAKTQKGQYSLLDGIEKDILENNLYGVDINEESVEIAKLALWLRTAKPHRKLNSLNDNIKCGNSLIDDVGVAGEKAFDWKKEFPQVFERGGFDVVIGNPPYVLCQPSNTPDNILNYYKQFDVASYKIDLFHLFFEQGIKLLKQNGKLGYITPNTYLTNKYIKLLRKFILNSTTIDYLVQHEDNVFADASVDVATIILSKQKKTGNSIILQKNKNSSFETIGTKEQNEWNSDIDYVFNMNADFKADFSDCVALNEICNTYFGIQAFDRKSSISETKKDEQYLEIIDGGDIFSFSYSIPNKYFNYTERNIKSGGDWNVYKQERLVVRQIGQIPIVGMCKKNVLASNTLYSIYPKIEDYELKYILCLLNSSVIKNYWSAKYSDNKILFPKIKGYQLKELPIKAISKEKQQPFIDLADKMLNLNADLQTKRRRFLKRLSDNFANIKITVALERFHELYFKDFVAELKKQKITLSLKQQDEWEEYFGEYKAECTELAEKIDSTDKEIDGMVYGLYGLSAEEIEVIENK